MPLTSQLPLTAAARSASDARRWVRTTMRELGRDDLLECAEVGVSELVANAVLHAQEPISVRVRGTATHPRIEVLDGSVSPPLPPEQGVDPFDVDVNDPEHLLSTFGRGLSLVARSANAWGATIESDGKIVWFEPAPDYREDGDVDWVIDQPVDPMPEPVSDSAVEVRFVGIDLALYERLVGKYRELRRELRLLSLSHEEAYPLARDLTAMFATFERQFSVDFQQQMSRAQSAGVATVDVSAKIQPESSPIFVTMREMFELADAFCRAERLLAIARTPLQREFQGWMISEVIGQLDGDPPRSWPTASAGSSAHLRPTPRSTDPGTSSSQVS